MTTGVIFTVCIRHTGDCVHVKCVHALLASHLLTPLLVRFNNQTPETYKNNKQGPLSPPICLVDLALYEFGLGDLTRVIKLGK